MHASDELSFATIEELAARLDRGELSSLELTENALARLQAIGRELNAVAALTPERARASARAADRVRARRGPGGAPQLLLGIPYGAKDLLAAKGAPTTWGTPIFADRVIDEDAMVLQRLGRRGGILVAKLAMTELATGTYPRSSLQGPALNPWDRRRWAGGSSGGSGAAVAAGLVPYALGSETSGSIGCPSTYTGVTGLRPTFGLVSRSGAMELSFSLDKVGPLARSAIDCGIVLAAIAGPDRADSANARRRFTSRALERAKATRAADLGRLRIAWAPTDVDVAAEPAIRRPLRDALDALRDLGIELVEAALPDELPYLEILYRLFRPESGAAFADLVASGGIDQMLDEAEREALRRSPELRAVDYLDAMRQTRAVRAAFADLFRRSDAIVSFTLPAPAPLIDTKLEEAPTLGGFSRLVEASNLAGLPALFLPVAHTADGLPVGIQLVGPPFSEARLIAIGAAFQGTTDWHRQRPPGLVE